MKKIVVLIIDDDEKVATIRSLTLKKCGLETLVAIGGENGLAVFKDLKPDIVLTDYNMAPGINGVEVIRAIKGGELATTPVILITGSGEGVMQEGLAAGADQAFEKTITSAALVNDINLLLKRKQ